MSRSLMIFEHSDAMPTSLTHLEVMAARRAAAEMGLKFNSETRFAADTEKTMLSKVIVSVPDDKAVGYIDALASIRNHEVTGDLGHVNAQEKIGMGRIPVPVIHCENALQAAGYSHFLNSHLSPADLYGYIANPAKKPRIHIYVCCEQKLQAWEKVDGKPQEEFHVC